MVEHVATLKPKSQQDIRGALKHPQFDAWREMRLEQITKRHVAELLNAVAVRDGHPTMANRLRAYVSKFFKWCGEQALWSDDRPLPTDRVARYKSGERVRERVLNDEELRLRLDATREAGSLFDLHLFLTLATGRWSADSAPSPPVWRRPRSSRSERRTH